jgi:acyl-CoA ligase (AMP-forming) (exosortase A-associated)
MLLIHKLLEDSAEQYPDKDALVFKDSRLSYKVVNEKANQLAYKLLKTGVRKGDRVAIYLDKCVEQATAIFALSKIGVIFVILSPLLNDAAVLYIINDCQIKGLISSTIRLSIIENSIRKYSPEFIIIIGNGDVSFPAVIKTFDYKGICIENKNNPHIDVKEDELATIIYTSGSTGMPKGVMLTQKNITLGAHSVSTYLHNTNTDVILGLLPLNFDYGLNQLMACFKVGGTLVMKTYLFPEEVIEIIHKEKVTGLAGIPTIWIQLLRAKNIERYEYKELRYITNSGDRLFLPHVERLKKVFPHTKIFLMYGLTEAFRATYLDPSEIDRRPGSIGKAIPNAEIYVINKKGEEAKPEEVGELIQGGPLVSKGYWGKFKETVKKIRQNPFKKNHKDLVCFSGDLVRKDKDGFFYFIGRESGMIKSLGYRISPTEIESVLYGNDNIKEAVAFGIPDELIGQKIKIVVTLKDKGFLQKDDIMKYCIDNMSSYMIPKEIEIIDEMPVMPSGKIDRPAILEKYRV